MSKTKMCPKWETSPIMAGNKAITGNCRVCPKNTNDACEIIPKKPKMVRVKAWAFKDEDGNIAAFNNIPDKPFYPCTILIDEKYLRRKP